MTEDSALERQEVTGSNLEEVGERRLGTKDKLMFLALAPVAAFVILSTRTASAFARLGSRDPNEWENGIGGAMDRRASQLTFLLRERYQILFLGKSLVLQAGLGLNDGQASISKALSIPEDEG